MSIVVNIPEKFHQKLSRELAEDEQVVWSDQPIPQAFTISTIATCVIGIPVTLIGGILFFACISMLLNKDIYSSIQNLNSFVSFISLLLIFTAGALVIFGILHLGLTLLYNPIRNYKNMSSTLYVITNKRVITINGSDELLSYPPEKCFNIYRKNKNPYGGDLFFSQEVSYNPSESHESIIDIGFINIKNPEEAEKEIQNLVKANAASINNDQ